MSKNKEYIKELKKQIQGLKRIPTGIPVDYINNSNSSSDDEDEYGGKYGEKYEGSRGYAFSPGYEGNPPFSHENSATEDIQGSNTNPDNPYTSHVLDINQAVFCVLSNSIHEILTSYPTVSDMLEHKNEIMAHCSQIIECAEKTHNYSLNQLCQGMIRGVSIGWCCDEKWQVILAFFLLAATCTRIHSMPVDNHIFMLHVPKRNSLENASGRPSGKIISGTVKVKVSPEISHQIANWKNLLQNFQSLLYAPPA